MIERFCVISRRLVLSAPHCCSIYRGEFHLRDWRASKCDRCLERCSHQANGRRFSYNVTITTGLHFCRPRQTRQNLLDIDRQLEIWSPARTKSLSAHCKITSVRWRSPCGAYASGTSSAIPLPGRRSCSVSGRSSRAPPRCSTHWKPTTAILSCKTASSACHRPYSEDRNLDRLERGPPQWLLPKSISSARSLRSLKPCALARLNALRAMSKIS